MTDLCILDADVPFGFFSPQRPLLLQSWLFKLTAHFNNVA
jgi:hypothetical protein